MTNEIMINEVAISAIIGGLIALIINNIYRRYSSARKLNLIRLALLDYSSKIGIHKSYRYLQDLDSVKECIALFGNNDMQPKNTSVDDMPMYNSEIFKSIAIEELRRVAYNTDNFIRILDIQFAKDYHREHMPYDLFVKFRENVDKYIMKLGVPVEEELPFVNNSPLIKKLRNNILNDIEMVSKRGKTTHNQYKKLVKHLSGNNLKWIVKYIKRQ